MTDASTWLGGWRAAHDAGRREAAAATDATITRWSWVLLVLTMLYVLIGNTPYQHEAVFPDPTATSAKISPVNRYAWLLLTAGALPILWVRRHELIPALQRLWPLCLLFVWFLATTTWALDPTPSKRRLFLYALDVVICVAICLGLKDSRRIHGALATACAVVIGIDLASWIVAPKASMTFLGLAAIHSHKNTLGAVMLLSGIVVGAYLFTLKRLSQKLLWGAIFLGCLALMVASRSKTSLAILLAVGAFAPALLLALKLRSELLLGLALSGASLVVGGLLAYLAFCFANGTDPLWFLARITFTGRTDVWGFTFGEWLKRPWTGFGFGSFWDIDPQLQPDLKTDWWFAQPTAPTNESHNGYLDLLVTTGVPGLVGALLILFRWMLRSLGTLRGALRSPTWRAPGVPYLTYLGLFPLLFFAHNWMESTYYNANTIFGFVILLAGVDIDLKFRSRPPAVA